MEKLNYTVKEGTALVNVAKKKVQKILDDGLDAILNNPLADTQDYLHTKAVEQSQISIFLATLQLHDTFKELCDLEFISGASNVLSEEETELSQVRHDKYAEINNNLVYEILVNIAIELLTDDEVLDIILNV